MFKIARSCIIPVYFCCLISIAACGGGGDPTTTITPTVTPPVTPPATNGTVSLSGKITYDFVPATYSVTTKTGKLDFSQTTAKPVRNASVKVLQGTTILVTTKTDDTGNYQLSYTPSGTSLLKLVVYAESANPPIQIADNTDGGAVWTMYDTLDGTSTTKNLHAASGWTGTDYVDASRAAAPFAILDSMYSASKAFLDVRTFTYPALTVYWSPKNTSQSGDKTLGFITTSHYSSSVNAIYILGKNKVDTDEFDKQVIVHEWVHYFQSKLSRSDSPGGSHSSGDIADPRLSFGEGSATAIAAMVMNDPLYVDSLWSGAGTLYAFGQSVETAPSPTDDPNPGVFSESSVIRLMYDIFDTGTNESYDQIGVGLGTFYDVMTGSLKTTDAMVTIGPFISGLKQQSGVSSSVVDTLLLHYTVGAITTQWGDGSASLRDMYTDVTSFPSTKSILLGGGNPFNSWQQNQYYVFTGNGAQVTVSATSAAYDVGIEVFQAGTSLATADKYLSGTETLTLATEANKKYVVVLTGYKSTTGDYTVTTVFTSP